jgi:hypothetical protein
MARRWGLGMKGREFVKKGFNSSQIDFADRISNSRKTPEAFFALISKIKKVDKRSQLYITKTGGIKLNLRSTSSCD